MEKEEKIKEAWGEYYEGIRNRLDEQGWYNYFSLTNKIMKEKYHQFNNLDLDEHNELYLLRPKSLQGIENNNGWIKIESEEDLPKEVIECRTCFYNGKNYIEGIVKKRSPQELSRLKYINEITHYQQIEKPKPPIY